MREQTFNNEQTTFGTRTKYLEHTAHVYSLWPMNWINNLLLFVLKLYGHVYYTWCVFKSNNYTNDLWNRTPKIRIPRVPERTHNVSDFVCSITVHGWYTFEFILYACIKFEFNHCGRDELRVIRENPFLYVLAYVFRQDLYIYIYVFEKRTHLFPYNVEWQVRRRFSGGCASRGKG
jgi:hypothetical protein